MALITRIRIPITLIIIALLLKSIYNAHIFPDDFNSSVALDAHFLNISSIALPHYEHVFAANVNATDTTQHQRKRRGKRKTELELKLSKISQNQKVFVLPNVKPSEAKGELSHFVLDGINRSTVLQRTLDVNDVNSVWVVDISRFKCLPELVQLLWDLWKSKRRTVPWDIYLLEFGDGHSIDSTCIKTINAVFNYQSSDNNICELITKNTDGNFSILNDDDGNIDESNCRNTTQRHVHYALRRHVHGRYINNGIKGNEDIPFGMLGKRIQYNNTDGIYGIVRVLRYGVRSDLVFLLERYQQMQMKNSSDPDQSIVTWSRPNDVAHFWGVGDDRIAGKLRSAVSKALIDLSTEQPSLKILAKQVGSRFMVGRNKAQEPYAVGLLQHKIVVVCQRDMWEDHYRLMEALAGGAMVMTDPMHPLPFKIEEGREVVVYRSIAELKKLVKYFLNHDEERLRIARSGYNAAMRYHRSWTWMERIIFGDWGREHGDS